MLTFTSSDTVRCFSVPQVIEQDSLISLMAIPAPQAAKLIASEHFWTLLLFRSFLFFAYPTRQTRNFLRFAYNTKFGLKGTRLRNGYMLKQSTESG
jgi:hypothetical protein